MHPVFRQKFKFGSFTRLRRASPEVGPRYLAEIFNGANQDDGLSVNLALSCPICHREIGDISSKLYVDLLWRVNCCLRVLAGRSLASANHPRPTARQRKAQVIYVIAYEWSLLV